MEKKSIIYNVARKTIQCLLEIITMILCKVHATFGPSNRETDKTRKDTETDSQNMEILQQEKKNTNRSLNNLNRPIKNNLVVCGSNHKASTTKKYRKPRKRKKLEIHLRVEQNIKGIHETDPKEKLRSIMEWTGMIRFNIMLIESWKSYNLSCLRKIRLIGKKIVHTNRHGLGSSKICLKIKAEWWFSQKRTIHFESHDHTKVGAAKISKPKFQRLFLATQKRTSVERSQKATTVKKFSAKKVSVKKKKMFKTVHKLNKNVVNLTNQGEMGKDLRKLEFNYPPLAAAKCRDGRYIQSTQIWVQGLPMDISQIIELIGVLKEQYGLPITDESKNLLCSQVAEMLLVPSWEKGSKPIEVIGSTIAVGAFVFELEEAKIFMAIPCEKARQTVLEFVTQATVMVRAVNNIKNNNKKEAGVSEAKEINITIIVMPWTLEVKKEDEIRHILRFHSFGMDAKSEMTHCILQEIALATEQELSSLRGIQVIPRTVFVESMPIGVLDVVISAEMNINIANLYVHFTGNASGGVQRVIFGGINAMVMASANINEMIFAKMPTNNIHWATLYGSEIQQTHYITQLLLAGGCRQDDIVSVIFAKPEQKLKKISSIIVERRVCSQRALTGEKCTIIFATAQALHQFVAYFKNTIVWQEYPKIQVGFNDTPYTGSIAVMAEQSEYMSLEQFEKVHSTEYTDANANNEVQKNLYASKIVKSSQICMTLNEKCYAAIQVLKRARDSMSTQMFKPIQEAVITELGLTAKRVRENDNSFEYFNTGSEGVLEYEGGKSGETSDRYQKNDMDVEEKH